MEHREPPPDGKEDSRIRSVAPAASDRHARPILSLPRPGQPFLTRPRARLGFALIVGVLIASYLAYLGARSARSWLSDQPAYQLPFRSIVLDPPPPSWYRGGAPGFLEDVRERASMPESIPLLQLKEAELQRAFQRSPWTEEVRTVIYPPLGATVRLAYRRPVALVETSKARRIYLVDREAVILPIDEVDLDELRCDRGLITIKGDDLAEPLDARPGLPWRPRAGLADLAPGNELIPAAARLADFLLEKLASIDRKANPALDIRYINPIDRGGRGLFLWNVEETYILWGKAPGEEGSDDLAAEEKWEKLCEWSRSTVDRRVPLGDYWKIGPAGVYHQQIEEKGNSARRALPRRDGSTIPARGLGQSSGSMSH